MYLTEFCSKTFLELVFQNCAVFPADFISLDFFENPNLHILHVGEWFNQNPSPMYNHSQKRRPIPSYAWQYIKVELSKHFFILFKVAYSKSPSDVIFIAVW